MAERLAPEQVPLLITSRPERPRGRGRRAAGRLVGGVLAVAVIAAGGAVTAHYLMIDRSAPELRATGLVPEGLVPSVLVVLARPGQEVPMAGTLAELDRSGARVSILTLTDGETQAPILESAADRLGELRSDELMAAGEVLGVETVTSAHLPDGALAGVDPAAVSGAIEAALAESGATTVLTINDTTGSDPDANAVAAYVMAAAQAEGSGVARVWTVTRSDREASWSQAIGSPIDAGATRPDPTVSVRIADVAPLKASAISAHGTLSPQLAEATYPYADRLPAWAYFQFLDREYFSLTWGTPLP